MGKVLHESALDVCQRAMAILRQENRLVIISPDAPTKIERCCYDAYETARMEVLSSYGWSFVKADKLVRGVAFQEEDGRFSISYPGDALKILQCYDKDGHKIPYTLRGNEKIYSLHPIYRITYIFNEENVNLWPPLVQEALVKTLAKNMCIEVTGRANDLQMLEVQCRAAVQNARTDDARRSSTGNEVYGKNYLYECMCGRKNPFNRRGL
jgi:hypothetical protein